MHLYIFYILYITIPLLYIYMHLQLSYIPYLYVRLHVCVFYILYVRLHVCVFYIVYVRLHVCVFYILYVRLHVCVFYILYVRLHLYIHMVWFSCNVVLKPFYTYLFTLFTCLLTTFVFHCYNCIIKIYTSVLSQNVLVIFSVNLCTLNIARQ